MATPTTQLVIHRPAQVTRRWLTAALRAAGAIDAAEVAMVSVAHWRGRTLSDLYRVEAAYAGPVPAETPHRFILKLSRSRQASTFAERGRWKEHEFYARVAASMPDPPAPRSFAAAYDPRRRRSHLLLEDLSESHDAPSSPLPPRRDQLRGAVDALAHIHAWWWNHPDLQGVTEARDDAWVAEKSAAIERRLARFLAELGDYLPIAMRAALETSARAWPLILRRTADLPLTVVHGDAHPWNLLYPRAADGRARLLDWEGWSIEPGPHDLASLLALHLPPSERHAAHNQLIAHYAARLRALGVLDYDESACWADYRLAVARRVLSPVALWSRGSKTRTWWPMLEHITAAYDEMRCDEIL